MGNDAVESHSAGRWIGRLLDLFTERGWRGGRDVAMAVLEEARRTSAPLDEVRIRQLIPSDFVAQNRTTVADVSRAVAGAINGWALDVPSAGSGRPHRVERRLTTDVLNGLEVWCPDFTGSAREDFTWLVEVSIRWLRSRLDATKRFANYLYESDTSKPLELDLHSDYKDFLEGSDAPAWVATELVEVGGGRVDIGVLFPQTRIPVELKRELSDASAPSIGKYLPQVAAYQASDVCLGVLIVLDLARESAEPVPNIRDLVHVERYTDNAGRTRCVVVFRVPGNRASPSSL